jgi:hypothetical protein
MNRLVERVAGPMIWVVNDIERLGPAVVRWMNLVMRFPKPSLAARKKMIGRISDRAEFRLDADETAKLARLPAAPALIAARHSWEITQVNELLTWMEHHPYPFACTTNATDLLDPATARRFLLKVRFCR